ncbi:hypothetical protein HMPREF1250_1283 [Megasphaera vaginalis (ex Srinivasan et al. 2021)]|uniref:Uncharacterized protein n=2 Tax=Megasphaera vaginalis (ex Srinivasan et al. 2021) TaxID=1111454 RepID=U7UU71_9FIRM|nr:hypothetical protein HMPREF1250_1283 [Megasphaera vaginalis (ex Srinivasan et al. 2021)]
MTITGGAISGVDAGFSKEKDETVLLRLLEKKCRFSFIMIRIMR